MYEITDLENWKFRKGDEVIYTSRGPLLEGGPQIAVISELCWYGMSGRVYSITNGTLDGKLAYESELEFVNPPPKPKNLVWTIDGYVDK